MQWILAMGAFSFLEACSALKTSFQRLSFHVTMPYHTKTEKEAPFMTVGPFASKDTLFHGIAREFKLYTAEEVITLRNAGIFKSSSSVSQSLPKLPSLTSLGQTLSSPPDPKVAPHSPKIELDSSSKK